MCPYTALHQTRLSRFGSWSVQVLECASVGVCRSWSVQVFECASVVSESVQLLERGV